MVLVRIRSQGLSRHIPGAKTARLRYSTIPWLRLNLIRF
jgi:hypothetical protein